MESMKRFVEERKKTIQEETTKLHVEYDAIITYLNSVIKKADANCHELLSESDSDRFRKKCLPALNWIQEKYDNFLLMHSFCLPAVELDKTLESSESLKFSEEHVERLEAATVSVDEISLCDSTFSGSDNRARYQPLVFPLLASASNLSTNPINPMLNHLAEGKHEPVCNSVTSSSFSESALRTDAAKVSCAIPKYRISDRTMKVMATCVISPWLFWVQVKSRGHELENLLDELTSYHSQLKRGDPDYRLPSMPKIGQLVSAQFTQDSMWYRAYVLAVFEIPLRTNLPGKKRIELDVSYVDYGNSERLSLSHVRPLPEEFLKLPIQAFVCSLSQVGPRESGDIMSWPESVLSSFGQLDCTQILTVRFSKPVPGCPISFLDILDMQDSANSRELQQVKQHTVCRKMIISGQAMYMSDNAHAAQWYMEKYSKMTQAAKPGEKMTSSLLSSDIHSAQMPVFDPGLFSDIPGPLLSSPNHLLLSCSDNRSSMCVKEIQATEPAQYDRSYSCFNTEIQVTSPSETNKSHLCLGDYQAHGCPNTKSKHTDILQSQNSFSPSIMKSCFDDIMKDNVSLVSCNDPGHRVVSEKFSRTNAEVDHNLSSLPDPGMVGSLLPTDSLLKPKSHCVGSVESDVLTFTGSHSKFFKKSEGVISATSNATVNGSQKILSAHCESVNCSKQETGLFPARRPLNKKSSEKALLECNTEGAPQSSWLKDWVKNQTLDRFSGLPCLRQEQKLSDTKASFEYPAESDQPEKIAQEALQKDKRLYDLHAESVRPEENNQEVLLQGTSALQNNLSADCGWPKKITHETLLPGNNAVISHNYQETSSATLSNSEPSRMEYGGKSLLEIENAGLEGAMTSSRLVIPSEGFIHFVMSFVESPSKFWIHLINENAKTIDYIGDELRKHSTSLTTASINSLPEYLANDEIIRDLSVCCARSTEDDELYRVEILNGLIKPASCESKSLEFQVEVFHVDFGNTEWISIERLMPLPSHLVGIPPFAICCCLDGVEPACRESSSASDWSKEATTRFMDMCGFTKGLVGIFPADMKAGNIVYPSSERPLRLQLIDPDADIPIKIGEQLVTLGLAKPGLKLQKDYTTAKTSKQETKDETTDGDNLDSWNPMAEDFLSQRNSYAVDVDDPGVATVNYKAKDEQRVCRFFNLKNSHCWRGDDCPYEHISYKGVVITTDRREVIGVCDSELELELPSVGSWVVVNVTCIIDPSRVYVVLPFGSKSFSDLSFSVKKPVPSSYQLDEHCDDYTSNPIPNSENSLECLMDSLQDFYKSKVFCDSDLIVYAEGEIVVVRCMQNECWHRARIIMSDPDNNRVKVFYVDFGNKEWVDNERVRQIELDFLHLPFQAVECRLPLCANNTSGKQWSELAMKTFLELAKAPYLVAHVLQSESRGLLYVDLYNTIDRDIHINGLLLEKGYARRTNEIAIRCHQSQIPHRDADRAVKNKVFLIPG